MEERKKRSDKLIQLIRKSVQGFGWLGMILFLFLAVASCFYTKRMYTGTEVLYGEWDNPLIKVLFGTALVLIYLLLKKIEIRLNDSVVESIAIVCSCLVTIFCILLTNQGDSIPESDQWYVYVAAEGLFQRDYKNLQDFVYYTVCPYQLGLAEVYNVIAKIAGTMSHSVLRYAQAICVGFSVYFVYGVGKQLCHNVKVQLLCLLFSIIFMPLSLYSQFLYGETIGVRMSLISIYFFLVVNRSGQKKWVQAVGWICSIFAFGFVYLVRPALTVIWVAMIMIQFCLCIRTKKWLPMLFMILMLLVGIGTQKSVVEFAGETAGVTTDNGMPVVPLTIAMGMQDKDPNHTGAGSYNAYNYNLFMETGYDKDMASYRAIRNIGGSLLRWVCNPADMFRHLRDKLLNQWTEPGYDAFTMTCNMEEPESWIRDLYYDKLHQFTYAMLDCFQTFCYFLLAMWFWRLIQIGKTGFRLEQIQDYLIGLIMVGEVFFSLLWEATSRYVYPYMVIVIPCVAVSMVFYCDYLSHQYTVKHKKRSESQK